MVWPPHLQFQPHQPPPPDHSPPKIPSPPSSSPPNSPQPFSSSPQPDSPSPNLDVANQPSPHRSPSIIQVSSDDLSIHTSVADTLEPSPEPSPPKPDATEPYIFTDSENSPNPSVSKPHTPNSPETSSENLSQSLSPIIQTAALSAEPATNVEVPPSGRGPQGSFGNHASGVQWPPSNAGSGPAQATELDVGSTCFLRGTSGNFTPSLDVFTTTELKSELFTRLNAHDSLSTLDSELRNVLLKGKQSNVPQTPLEIVQETAEKLRSLADSLIILFSETCSGVPGSLKRPRDDPDEQDPRGGGGE